MNDNKNMNKKSRIGRYIKSSIISGKSYKCYIPTPLPFVPNINLNNMYNLLDRANLALGRLDEIGNHLPDKTLFLLMYLRKEAVFSSQIEGTLSTLSDIILYEAKEKLDIPIDDIHEVFGYIKAMQHGLSRLQEGFPLCLRLIREMHSFLMNNERGKNKQPGEFRKSQNWIGGTCLSNAVFIPPPPEELMSCLDNFEKFLHGKMNLPILVKVAVAHIQFETIHPFLDGNGRIGRLLINFMLCNEGVLKYPLLYISLYFKKYHQQYYEYFQYIQRTGDWEKWVEFFLDGVIETSEQAIETVKLLTNQVNDDLLLLKNTNNVTPSILTIHSYLQKQPIVNIAKVSKDCNCSLSTSLRSLKVLQKLGIVEEKFKRKRKKLFIYRKYLKIWERG